MNRINQVFLVLALLSLGLGCKKDDLGPGTEILYRKDFQIQAGLGTFVVHHFYLNNVASNYAATLTAENLTDAQITAVTNISGELSTVFGDGNLDFVHRISVRVFPEGEPFNYIEVAYRDPTPLTIGTNLGLIPSLADAKSILRKDRFGIDIAIETRNLTSETIPVRIDLKFKATY
jgi:hypothetical protein